MFRKYAASTKCFAIYDFSECVDVIEGVEMSKKNVKMFCFQIMRLGTLENLVGNFL